MVVLRVLSKGSRVVKEVQSLDRVRLGSLVHSSVFNGRCPRKARINSECHAYTVKLECVPGYFHACCDRIPGHADLLTTVSWLRDTLPAPNLNPSPRASLTVFEDIEEVRALAVWSTAAQASA